MNTKHIKVDIPEKSYFKKRGIIFENYSVLALSVYKANFDFIDNYSHGKILEIGCGSDSVIESSLKENWQGIDVVSHDRHGNPSLATKFGSVHDIPFDESEFDIAISNQSIEHWYEYNVSFEEAFNEVNRILKIGGNFIFNFPVHLHGHKFFVLNTLDIIDNKLLESGFKITSKTHYTSKTNYKGWLKCGFPTLYLKLHSPDFKKTSFVIEYNVEKVKNVKTKIKEKKLKNQKSRISKRLHHGFLVLAYNIFKKLLK